LTVLFKKDELLLHVVRLGGTGVATAAAELQPLKASARRGTEGVGQTDKLRRRPRLSASPYVDVSDEAILARRRNRAT
jgi:hypothetical protein